MSQSNEFDRLEQFVRKLLTQHEQLLEKNAHLQKLLQQRENEIIELKEKIDSADSERGDISSRIKNLIDQIEEWQSSITEPLENDVEQEYVAQESEAPEEEEASEEEDPEVQEDAPSESAEVQEGEGPDEGPQRNQRNLFHVGPDQ